jgi:hypothetical protein
MTPTVLKVKVACKCAYREDRTTFAGLDASGSGAEQLFFLVVRIRLLEQNLGFEIAYQSVVDLNDNMPRRTSQSTRKVSILSHSMICLN